jgi:hypothetical protein
MRRLNDVNLNNLSLMIHFEAGVQSAKEFLNKIGVSTSSAIFANLDSKIQVKRCIKGFPCGKSCQKRGYKCANPLPGQFVTYREYIENGVKQFLSTPKGIQDAEGYLAIARSIARNPSEKVRKDVVSRLRKQAEKDENLHTFFEQIGLEDAILYPAKFARSLAQARLAINPDTDKIELKFTLKTPKVNLVEDIDDNINNITVNKPNDVDALNTIKDFQAKITFLNDLITNIDKKNNFSDDDYESYFTQINNTAKELFALKKQAITQLSKVSEPIISKVLNQLSNISAENLPGHKLAVLNSITNSETKNAINPC